MTCCVDRGFRGTLARVAWSMALAALAAAAGDLPTATNAWLAGVPPVATVTNAAASDDTGTNAAVRTGPAGAEEYADLAETWRKQPEADASPVENLTLPIEHYENGRVRAVLHAGKAAIGRAGMIWSWQVAVDLFNPVGQPDGRVEAECCLYDRNSRRGYCPTGVRLVRTNATVTGTGMYWSMADQRMRILSEPVVQTDHGIRTTGGRGGAAGRWWSMPEATNRPVRAVPAGEHK